MSELQYYTVEGLVPEKNVGLLIRRCGALMARFAERRFESEPLSFTQWFVLAGLTPCEHMSQTALSERISYDAGALTRVIDLLVSKGLVRRERSKRDRRAVEIKLTADGRRHLQSGKRVLVDLLNELATRYSRRELETFIELMQRMLLRLQESESAQPHSADLSPRALGV